MIGKKNIVFGLLYLFLTAALGPFMIINYFDDVAIAEANKQEKVGILQQAVTSGFEFDLEPMTAEQIAKTNSAAILAISGRLNSQGPVDAIKGGPHAHGNLEALLNITIGLLLCFLATSRTVKQTISWIFIAGAVTHSGLLYLAQGFQFTWAQSLLASPVGYIGPLLILVGLVLAGVVASLSFRGTLEADM